MIIRLISETGSFISNFGYLKIKRPLYFEISSMDYVIITIIINTTLGFFGCCCYVNFISLTDYHVYNWELWLLLLCELHFPDRLSCLYLGTLVASVLWTSFPWRTFMVTLGYFGRSCYVNFISLTDFHVYTWVLWLLLLCELHFPDGLSCLHLGTLVVAVMWTSFPWRTFMFTLG